MKKPDKSSGRQDADQCNSLNRARRFACCAGTEQRPAAMQEWSLLHPLTCLFAPSFRGVSWQSSCSTSTDVWTKPEFRAHIPCSRARELECSFSPKTYCTTPARTPKRAPNGTPQGTLGARTSLKLFHSRSAARQNKNRHSEQREESLFDRSQGAFFSARNDGPFVFRYFATERPSHFLRARCRLRCTVRRWYCPSAPALRYSRAGRSLCPCGLRRTRHQQRSQYRVRDPRC